MMKAVPLSPRTRDALRALFEPDERADVEYLLLTACNSGPASTPAGSERVRLAALKVSGGDLGKLIDALDLAQTDWRDLLMAAGFGHDPDAHKHWRPGTHTLDN